MDGTATLDVTDPTLTGLESLLNDPKAVHDLSEETAKVLSAASALVGSGKVDEGVELCISLEKRARQAHDGISVSKLVLFILNAIKAKDETDNFEEVRTTFLHLLRRRGQLKRAKADAVALIEQWIESSADQNTKKALIDMVLKGTEGEISLEVERAKMLLKLASIQELTDGNLNAACQTMQQIHTETLHGLSKLSRAEYVLEQMRLTALTEDYVRCHIFSRKIPAKIWDTDEFQDLKMQFKAITLEFLLKDQQYLEMAHTFKSLYGIPKLDHQNKPEVLSEKQPGWPSRVANFVPPEVLAAVQGDRLDLALDLLKRYYIDGYGLFLVLAERSEERDGELKQLAQELTPVDLTSKHRLMTPGIAALVRKLDISGIFRLDGPTSGLVHETVSTHYLFKRYPQFKDLLRLRILQHNLRTLAAHYSQVPIKRIETLLGPAGQYATAEIEKELAYLIRKKQLPPGSKIDRPNGIVILNQRQADSSRSRDDEATLLPSKWIKDQSQVTLLLEESRFIILKERYKTSAVIS